MRPVLFINAFPAQSCWSQLSQRKIFPKEKKKTNQTTNQTTKSFQLILVENFILWWSGYVSNTCYLQLAPRIENAIQDYRQNPTQGPTEWADAALAAGGRRALHLLLGFGSSADSVDQNCSQKSQANVYAWHRNKFPSGFSVSRMLFLKTKRMHEVNIMSRRRA